MVSMFSASRKVISYPHLVHTIRNGLPESNQTQLNLDSYNIPPAVLVKPGIW